MMNIKAFKNFNKYRFLLLIWVILLLVLSFFSPNWLHMPYPFPAFDKVKHLIGAFFLAILLFKSYRITSIISVCFIWVAISFVIEFLQYFFTHGRREFSLGDILANIVGFIVGIFIVILLRKKNSKIKS